MPDVGYYTLPVILSFKGIDKQVNDALGGALKPAAQKAGTAYSDEFNKQVEKDVGKKMPDTIGKATKDTGSGGIRKAAKSAADEFGQGFIKGVEQAITGGITSGNLSLEPINQKVRQTTDLIKQIGGATGIDTSGIDTIGNKITGVLGNIETEAGKVTTHFRDLNSNLDELGKKGEGGKLDNLAGKIGLVGDAINIINDIKATSEDWNTWAEEHISWYKWMNEYTPDKIGQMARDRVNAFFGNISGNNGVSGPAVLGPNGTPVPASAPPPSPNPLQVFAPTGPQAQGTSPPGTPPAVIPKPKPTVGGGAAGPVGPTNQGPLVGGGGSGVPAAVTPSAVTTPLPGPGQVKQVVMNTFAAAGYGAADLAKLDYILMHESHYDIKATNPATGDFGVFQFNPAAGNVARYLPDKSLNPQVQANAGLRYFQEHYGGDMNAAYQHKLQYGWYDKGGAVPIIAHEGEHVLTAADVQAMGGQGGVYAFRNMLHMDDGGGVDDPWDWRKKGKSFSLPSSISGLSSWGFDQMVSDAKSGPGHRDPMAYFGKAASAAVSGQVSSLLSVFGINDSPGWLQGISQLVGGIKIGGSAAPLSASTEHKGTGALPGPGNSGQPQTVTNWVINARDTEDAFIKAQRLERERAAAKLDRY